MDNTKIDLKANNIFVLAGNNQQAKYYFHSRRIPYDPRKVINRPEVINGQRNITVICIGTYYERKDKHEILNMIRCTGSKIVFDNC